VPTGSIEASSRRSGCASKASAVAEKTQIKLSSKASKNGSHAQYRRLLSVLSSSMPLYA
jgi:hypothetical protein